MHILASFKKEQHTKLVFENKSIFYYGSQGVLTILCFIKRLSPNFASNIKRFYLMISGEFDLINSLKSA